MNTHVGLSYQSVTVCRFKVHTM